MDSISSIDYSGHVVPDPKVQRLVTSEELSCRLLGVENSQRLDLISTLDREIICGSKSYSLKTWHSGRIEIVDSPKLPKPIFQELIGFIG
jgi:hypothetical protein